MVAPLFDQISIGGCFSRIARIWANQEIAGIAWTVLMDETGVLAACIRKCAIKHSAFDLLVRAHPAFRPITISDENYQNGCDSCGLWSVFAQFSSS
jgi:hypothetical protein